MDHALAIGHQAERVLLTGILRAGPFQNDVRLGSGVAFVDVGKDIEHVAASRLTHLCKKERGS
jgi:hypothetical protein